MLIFQTADGDVADDGGDSGGLSNGLDHFVPSSSSQTAVSNVDGFNSSTTVCILLLTLQLQPSRARI